MQKGSNPANTDKLAAGSMGVEMADLQHDESGLRQVLDNAPLGIVVERGGRILYANAKYADMLGYANACEIVAMGDVITHVSPKDRKYLKEIRENRKVGKASSRFEHRVLSRQGRAIWVEIQTHEVEWEDQNALLMAVADITDRKNLMSALSRAQPQKLDHATSGADWIWETDPEHRITLMTSPEREDPVSDPPNVIGRTRAEIHEIGSGDTHWLQYQRVLNERRILKNFEFQRVDGQGSRRHLAISGSPVHDDKGQFRGYRGTGTDRTEQLLKENPEQSAARHLGKAIGNLPVPVALWDGQDKFVYCNNKYRDLFSDSENFSHLEVGCSYQDTLKFYLNSQNINISGEAYHLWMRGRRSARRGGHGEAMVDLDQGKKLVCHDSLLDDGSVLTVLIELGEIATLDEQLKVQQSRYQQTLDTVNQAVITLDQQSRIVEFNSAAAALFGYRSREVIGHTIHILMPDDLRNSGDGPLVIYRRGERSPTSSQARRFTGRRKDGSEFPYEMTVRVWRSGEERFITGVIRDLTVELETQRAMDTARREAEEASRLKSEFLSSMSHELRTPLNAILGFSQLLASDQQNPLTPDQVRFSSQIEKAGGHLLSMINEVLDLAKIEAGQMTLAIASVNLVDLLQRVCETLAPAAAARNIRLDFPLAAGSKFQVRGDQKRLHQCFVALVGRLVNSKTRDGEVALEVRHESEGILRVDVRGPKPGLPFQDLDRVFEVFGRLSESERDVDGAGLGLPIAKCLLDLMEGSVAAVSEPGGGTRFVIRLPTDSSAGGEQADTTGANRPKGIARTPKRSSVLLYVEDHQANRLLMRQIVAKLPGVTLVLANTGEAGVALFEKHHPDLVILDINLPDIDGYEVLHQIQALDGGSVPVLALSANATEFDIAKGYQAGFQEYLTKPVEVPRLVESIEASLNQKEDR